MERRMRPIHPGELLTEIFQEQNLNVSPTAKLLGISRQQLHRILKGAAPITPHLAVKIGKLMGNGPRLWINMQASYDVAKAESEMAAAIACIPTIRDISLSV